MFAWACLCVCARTSGRSFACVDVHSCAYRRRGRRGPAGGCLQAAEMAVAIGEMPPHCGTSDSTARGDMRAAPGGASPARAPVLRQSRAKRGRLWGLAYTGVANSMPPPLPRLGHGVHGVWTRHLRGYAPRPWSLKLESEP
jgi:hypothetical protein